jgi:Domain of unknown function (DUF4082)
MTVMSKLLTFPRSIWDDSTTNPTLEASSDNQAAELGVKFQSEMNGFITGIRFYKGSTNIGTHTGTLWSSTGQELAIATFTSETASGWQQVSFPTPVPITANTTYVASYHTDVGHYAVTNDAFISGLSNFPLQVLKDDENDRNGVYKYGVHGFPINTYRASNYWVDVMFNTEPTFKQVVVIAGTGTPDGLETNPLSAADPTVDTPINSGVVLTNAPIANNYLQIGLQFRVLKPVKFCGCRLWLPAEEIATSTQKTIWLWNLRITAKAADIVTPTLVQGWNQINLKDADQIVLAPGDYIISTVFQSAYPARNFFYQSPIPIGDFAQAIMGVYDDANPKPNGVIPTMNYEGTSYYVDVLLKSTGAATSVNVREHVENYPTFKENFQLDSTITNYLVNSQYDEDLVMAYTDKESVNVGETVNIKGSAKIPGNVRIEIIRVGYYNGQGGKIIATTTVPFTDQTSAERIDAPDSNITTPLVKRCEWNTVYSYNVPTNAITGVYYIRLTYVGDINNGTQNYAFFVVRNDAIAGDILVKINTNTYAAYNTYGDSSFYKNITPKISKERPTGNWSGINNIQRWELCTIYWLERMGYRVSYCTDQDVHEKGEVYLRQFKVHLSSGHDEYWTKKQYNEVFNAVNNGLNLVLLSSNAAYWLGRYEDNNRTFCVYKNSVRWFDPNTILINDPVEPTCRPRDSLLLNSPVDNLNNQYPETKLWGVMYTNDDAPQGFDYRINAKRFDCSEKDSFAPPEKACFALPEKAVYSSLGDPLFEGTGFKDGDILPNCAGYEIDHISNSWMPEIKNGTQFRILNECGYEDLLQPGILEPNWGVGWRSDPNNDGWVWTNTTQDNFPPNSDHNLWRVGQTVYFERPNGAKCFASGHNNTPYCLAPSYMRELNAAGDPKESNAFSRLLQNVFTSMNVWGAYSSLEIIEGKDLPDLIAENGTIVLSSRFTAVTVEKPHVPTLLTALSSGNGILNGECAAVTEANQYKWQYSKDNAAFSGEMITITNTVQWTALDAGSYCIRVQAINTKGESAYSVPSDAVDITLRTQALSKLEVGTTFTIASTGEYHNEHRYRIMQKKADGSMVIVDEAKQLEREWSVGIVNSYLFVEVIKE